jgi:hypothetical protein
MSNFVDNLGFLLFVLFLGCIGFGLIGIVYKGITSDESKIEYCYVESLQRSNVKQQILLKGSIDWNNDKTISVFDTYQEAIKAAEDLKCPLMKK